MARNYNYILPPDPFILGKPEPDNRSKAERAEADVAMKAELARREARAAETARAEAARKIALAEATAKAEAERKLAEAEKIPPPGRRRYGIGAMFD